MYIYTMYVYTLCVYISACHSFLLWTQLDVLEVMKLESACADIQMWQQQGAEQQARRNCLIVFIEKNYNLKARLHTGIAT